MTAGVLGSVGYQQQVLGTKFLRVYVDNLDN